jgi:hypothetical protein
MLKILAAADQLHLQELVDYLQNYLIENEYEWYYKHFEQVFRFSLKSNSLLELQQFCTDCMAKDPDEIFESLDFTSLPEKTLISLIKRDDLQMKEIEVWEHVLKWGLAQNQKLSQDPTNWSNDDFKTMQNTLRHCLPLVRFFSLPPEEFIQKIYPYNQLLKPQLYEDLFKSYLDPNSKPSDDILLPRYKSLDGIIDSKIVNSNIVSIISRWIDKIDIKSKFAYARELYLPFKFKLLLRGSRDGFTPNRFHTLCNNIPHTVIFIKVKETEEILGGYNPSIWKNSLPVTDYENIANKIMPELEQEIEDFKYNTWNITNWSDLKKKTKGPEFKVGDWKWQIMLEKNKDDISIYLCTGNQNLPKDWHSCVQFALVLWNFEDPTQYVFESFLHRFTAEDWNLGIQHPELRELFTPTGTRTRALIENNSVNITAFVRVLKDPTGDLWLNDPDSKKIKILKRARNPIDVGKTKDSFIFSFKNKNDFKDPVLSYIKNMDDAIYYFNDFGPAFSTDLILRTDGTANGEYNKNFCLGGLSYEKSIRETKTDDD